ncbi:MAG TPA: ABC-F type ribosomal protection protein [Bacilli bacterium]|nr:ABC-F type ribosomal protection protein [Bacilli bacterium]
MAMISVVNLTFKYDGSYDNIFENVSFNIDTDWKLGFVGRNGRGKTTFLNLLMGKYEYSGNIHANVNFDYFPFTVPDEEKNAYQIAYDLDNNSEVWRLEKEVNLMNMNPDLLERPFKELSKGEQTRILLAMLFIKDNNFLLIDEPTNHLDSEARMIVANYLKNKKGFILVSHDRKFIDICVNHILSINKANIEIQQGNFSTWWENRQRQDNFELAENEKLKRDISRLTDSAKQSANWAGQIEASKYNMRGDILQDKGYIGHKSAKMMKRSLNAQARKEKAIVDKSKLLKNVETIEPLKMTPLPFTGDVLIAVNNLAINYGENTLFRDIFFNVEPGDRIQLKGANGSGKSSLIKLLLGEDISYSGELYIANNLKISYISQDTSYLKGKLETFAAEHNIDETQFKSILRKLGFERIQFEKNIENFSEGQKKQVLIAKSLCEEANIYIWDEPLNYIDVISRTQIEDVILNYAPTLIFVEHDETFSEKIATKVVTIHQEEVLRKRR